MSVWADIRKRSSGEVTRRKDDVNMDSLDFVDENPDPNGLLKDSEKVSIIDAALAHFKFGEFSSLNEMLFCLGVKLVISAAKPVRAVPDAISEWKRYWENVKERFKEGPLFKEAMDEAEKAAAEAKSWKEMTLLGCYNRYKKIIYLYPNNIEQCKIREKYLVTTFVHEAMHAYFDRHPHELFPYVATVEEPLAEFGMLLFLKEAEKLENGSYVAVYNEEWQGWAKTEVGNKKTCYRYGAVLMDSYDKGNTQIRQDIEAYKRKLF